VRPLGKQAKSYIIGSTTLPGTGAYNRVVPTAHYRARDHEGSAGGDGKIATGKALLPSQRKLV